MPQPGPEIVPTQQATPPEGWVQVESDLSYSPEIIARLAAIDTGDTQRLTTELQNDKIAPHPDELEVAREAKARAMATTLTLMAKVQHLNQHPNAEPTFTKVKRIGNTNFAEIPKQGLTAEISTATPHQVIEGKTLKTEDHTVRLRPSDIAAYDPTVTKRAEQSRDRLSSLQAGNTRGREAGSQLAPRETDGEAKYLLGNTQFETDPQKVALEALRMLKLAERYESAGYADEGSSGQANLDETARLRLEAAKLVRDGFFLTSKVLDAETLQRVENGLRAL